MRLASLAWLMSTLGLPVAAGAEDEEPITLGPEKCQPCHAAEHAVCEQTLHATEHRMSAST